MAPYNEISDLINSRSMDAVHGKVFISSNPYLINRSGNWSVCHLLKLIINSLIIINDTYNNTIFEIKYVHSISSCVYRKIFVRSK